MLTTLQELIGKWRSWGGAKEGHREHGEPKLSESREMQIKPQGLTTDTLSDQLKLIRHYSDSDTQELPFIGRER